MFYIFHGDDTHTQKEALQGLLTKLGDPGLVDLNTTRLEGAIPYAQLVQACSAMPFLARARVVLVYNFFTSKPEKALLQQVLAYLPQVPESARLIFLESEKLPPDHVVLQAAQTAANGHVRLFQRPEGAGIERWIRQRAAEKNGRISLQAAQLLAANIGNDLQILDNELEKLLLYAGEREITSEDVQKLCVYVAEASIFDLVDAIGSRNGKKAALLLQQKLNEGADPFGLFAMFIRQFRLLIQVKALSDAGEKPPAIAKALRLHGFVAGKIQQQARGFTLAQLEQIYRHLLEIDVAVKTGRNDLETALILLVGQLAIGD